MDLTQTPQAPAPPAPPPPPPRAAPDGVPAPAESVYPDRPPVPAPLDPAAALAYRTPLWEHTHNADNKAAGILALLGIMFALLARFGSSLGEIVSPAGGDVGDGGGGAGMALRILVIALLAAFALSAFGAVAQACRTISPRFPPAPPSLAFFGDIARLSREQYLERVEHLTPKEALDHMLAYNHTGSVICVAKFRELQRCFRCFQAAATCWVPLMAVAVFRTVL